MSYQLIAILETASEPPSEPLQATLLQVATTAVSDPSAGLYITFSVIIFSLLLLSALVSGAEVAFFSFSQDDIRRFRASNNETEQQVVFMRNRSQQLLATILILNNLINVGIVTLSTYLTWIIAGSQNPQGATIVILSVVTTFLIVFFGEVTPKVYASQNALKLVAISYKLLNVANRVFYPFAWLLMEAGDFLEKRLRRKNYDISPDAIRHAVEITTTQNVTADERNIYDRIVEFSHITVRQIMQSRMDIVGFDMEDSFHVVMNQINKSGYSRFPVYNETIDKIEGLLYIKDLLPYTHEDEHFDWQKHLRKCYFVPENKKIDDLLKDFQRKRMHMAVVADEYGGTSGLITLEDILEEIVGDISDEFDSYEALYKQIDENTFIFEAKISLHDFCKAVESSSRVFDDIKGESESLGGLLLELNSRLPVIGEVIEFESFLFTVVSADKRRLKKIRVQLTQISNNNDEDKNTSTTMD